MATTTNYGWTTPDDTALVKDGAAAIRSLGSSIDSTLKTQIDAQIPDSLLTTKGDVIAATAASTPARLAVGTNNQVLMADSAAATGLKYANEATATLTAKGDVLTATAANTLSRLAVGANNTVLTADSTTATGLKWAAPTSGANWSLVNAGGTALTGATTITISGISNADKILIAFTQASSANAGSAIQVRVNSNSGNIYNFAGGQITAVSTWAASNVGNLASWNATAITIASMGSNAASQVDGTVLISGAAASGVKAFTAAGGGNDGGSSNNTFRVSQGVIDTSSAITSVNIISTSGNFDNGTVYVYTSA